MLNNFLNNFPIVFLKKPPVYITKYYKLHKYHKLLLSCKDMRSINFLQRNDVPSNFVENLHGNTFLLFTFIKSKDYWNFTYTDM